VISTATSCTDTIGFLGENVLGVDYCCLVNTKVYKDMQKFEPWKKSSASVESIVKYDLTFKWLKVKVGKYFKPAYYLPFPNCTVSK